MQLLGLKNNIVFIFSTSRLAVTDCMLIAANLKWQQISFLHFLGNAWQLNENRKMSGESRTQEKKLTDSNTQLSIH